MTAAAWQEIDRLRTRVRHLRGRVSRQLAQKATHPRLRCGDVSGVNDIGAVRVYSVTERTVNAQLSNNYASVYSMTGSAKARSGRMPRMMALGRDGNRYFLPKSSCILVQDQGSNNGKEIELDTAGAITTPAGSETLPMVPVEPASKFHSSTYPFASGRMYPGTKEKTISGTGYYLVWLAGHGPTAKTFSTEQITDTHIVTANLSVDYAGKVTDFVASSEERSSSSSSSSSSSYAPDDCHITGNEEFVTNQGTFSGGWYISATPHCGVSYPECRWNRRAVGSPDYDNPEVFIYCQFGSFWHFWMYGVPGQDGHYYKTTGTINGVYTWNSGNINYKNAHGNTIAISGFVHTCSNDCI